MTVETTIKFVAFKDLGEGDRFMYGNSILTKKLGATYVKQSNSRPKKGVDYNAIRDSDRVVFSIDADRKVLKVRDAN